MIKLSNEQQKIVDLYEGQHLVLAPPGTGKTELLVHRLSNAINSGIPQEEIACLTFTNRAAENMVERVHQEIGDNDIFIGNIHSFCNRYLIKNNLIPQITSLLDEEDQRQMFSDVIFDVTKDIASDNSSMPNKLEGALKDLTNADYFSVSAILAHLSYLKRKDFKIVDSINYGALNLDTYTSLFSDPILSLECRKHVISLIYSRYEQLKDESNYIDFDDLLTLSYFNLSQKLPQDNFEITWLQVDEAQDLNPFQWGIIDKISDKKHSHRVFFGDYDQSIFSFMGASTESLKFISKTSVVHYMQINYRSPQYLLDLYNQYASNELAISSKFKPKAFNKVLKVKGDLRIKHFSRDQYDEANNIVTSEFPVDKDYSVAILVRTNESAEMYASQFKTNMPNVRIFKVSGVDLFSRRITKDALSVLNIFVNSRDKLSWSRVFHISTGQTLKQSRFIINSLFNAGINPIDILFNNANSSSLLDDFLHLYNSARLVVFDTETTGLNTNEDDIIQIAAIEIIKGVPGKIFEVYIDTNRDFKEAEKIHHISKEYLSDHAIEKHLALSDFVNFIGDSAIIAHNLDYDYKILNNNLERVGLPLIPQETKLYDSVDITQRLHPKLPRYKLEYLLKVFNIEGSNSHNAVDDVKATVGLIEHCIIEIESTKLSRMAYIDNETSKSLIKFSNNFMPLYELLSDNAKIINLGDVVSNVVSYIDDNFNSESRKYKDNAYVELKKLIEHMNHICQEQSILKGIKKYIPDYFKYKEVDLKLKKDNVVIATVYKAKGLEFDFVIIPQCTENTYPSYFSIKKEQKNDISGVQEDARLLYVAMTRAKKRLLITYTSYTIPIKAVRKYYQCPSRFLKSIRALFDR